MKIGPVLDLARLFFRVCASMTGQLPDGHATHFTRWEIFNEGTCCIRLLAHANAPVVGHYHVHCVHFVRARCITNSRQGVGPAARACLTVQMHRPEGRVFGTV